MNKSKWTVTRNDTGWGVGNNDEESRIQKDTVEEQKREKHRQERNLTKWRQPIMGAKDQTKKRPRTVNDRRRERHQWAEKCMYKGINRCEEEAVVHQQPLHIFLWVGKILYGKYREPNWESKDRYPNYLFLPNNRGQGATHMCMTCVRLMYDV